MDHRLKTTLKPIATTLVLLAWVATRASASSES